MSAGLAFLFPADSALPVNARVQSQSPTDGPSQMIAGSRLYEGQKRMILARTAGKTPNGLDVSVIATITPGSLHHGSSVFTYLESPAEVCSPPKARIEFNPGSSSEMVVYVNVQPNTSYLFDFTVTAIRPNRPNVGGGGTIPDATFVVGTGQTSEKTTGPGGGDLEFAFAYTANKGGTDQVWIESPNVAWQFKECVITATSE